MQAPEVEFVADEISEAQTADPELGEPNTIYNEGCNDEEDELHTCTPLLVLKTISCTYYSLQNNVLRLCPNTTLENLSTL